VTSILLRNAMKARQIPHDASTWSEKADLGASAVSSVWGKRSGLAEMRSLCYNFARTICHYVFESVKSTG
jgi:hypothetical protein